MTGTKVQSTNAGYDPKGKIWIMPNRVLKENCSYSLWFRTRAEARSHKKHLVTCGYTHNYGQPMIGYGPYAWSVRPLPSMARVVLIFDLSNGHPGSHQYCWLFTGVMALQNAKFFLDDHRRNPSTTKADLSQPRVFYVRIP